jgi:ribonuclease BN (tRNA processing enzyme)
MRTDPLKIRVLGCSGAIARDCRTTSFLVDGSILIDAGTGVGDLRLDEMAAISDVFLTHSHLDHVAALPLMLDAVGTARAAPLRVHALPETIAALRAHIFNDQIWPDFERIPTPERPFLHFHAITTGEVLTIGGRRLEVLPAVHSVPAVGYAIEGLRGHWVFSGDTGPNPGLWQRVNQLQVAALVIETAFSNREKDLAALSLHLSPESLAHELSQINPGRRFPIYITHTKPSEADLIMVEVRHFDHAMPSGEMRPHDIRWLQAGLEFAV